MPGTKIILRSVWVVTVGDDGARVRVEVPLSPPSLLRYLAQLVADGVTVTLDDSDLVDVVDAPVAEVEA